MISIQTYRNSNKNNLNVNQKLSLKNVRQRFIMTITLIFLAVTFNTAIAIEPQQKAIVKKVVEAFKKNDRASLSNMVSYPLFRQAPLAPINNQKEFLERYDEIFDGYLLSTITNSDINTDWDNIGWRGVILGNGIVALDPEGNITEINHHSQREQALVNQLNKRNIAKGRRALHRSVDNYDQALVELTTERFRIRVDNVGKGVLRYTSWPINKDISSKPDLILSNGHVIDGSGRNQRFVFDNGTYSYHINIDASATNTPAASSLEVFKSGQPWIREVATRVIRR